MFAVLQYAVFVAALWLWTTLLFSPSRRLVGLVARVGAGR